MPHPAVFNLAEGQDVSALFGRQFPKKPERIGFMRVWFTYACLSDDGDVYKSLAGFIDNGEGNEHWVSLENVPAHIVPMEMVAGATFYVLAAYTTAPNGERVYALSFLYCCPVPWFVEQIA